MHSVCTCAYVCVCVHACVYVYVRVCMRVCAPVCTFMCICACERLAPFLGHAMAASLDVWLSPLGLCCLRSGIGLDQFSLEGVSVKGRAAVHQTQSVGRIGQLS